jgi:hypothetical protein
MKIQINDHRKIFAVQGEFTKFFPHMRIDFLSKSSNLKSSAPEKIVNSSKTLGDCRAVHAKGELTLLHSMTVADLKETLRDAYGLSVVVLRKTGTKWIETQENANLSLDEQDIK